VIKAIFFDFDGVLTVDKTGSITTTRYLSHATGIDLSRVQAAFRKYNTALTFGETTHADIWEDLCGELGHQISIGLLNEAFESTPMNARMFSLARDLKSTYSVGIITDNKKDRIDHLKKFHGLPSLFDPIVVSAEVGASKESPKIFQSALRCLDICPHECVFIDNSEENLDAPRTLGIRTIYFDDERQDFAALLAALGASGVRVGDA
jgi:putative hydrolase of the HAD superfamily